MDISVAIDWDHLARDLDVPIAGVQRTVELLDEGNTVPFITRFRKDQTGGIDEPQIRRIQKQVEQLRSLARRKEKILNSIEAQGMLIPELSDRIRSARTAKWLEDLYLPYKPKKQTLATKARERGLEPLAVDVLEANVSATDLENRVADFVDEKNQLATTADVLAGVRHLLAERFSERADLHGRLRKIAWRTGKLASTRIVKPTSEEADVVASAVEGEAAADTPDVSGGDHAGSTFQSGQTDVSDEKTDPADGEKVEPAAQPASEPPQDNAKSRSKRRAKKKSTKDKKLENAFKNYFEFSESLTRVLPHRVLAINRGERAGMLRVKVEMDTQVIQTEAETLLVAEDHPHADLLRGCVRDGLNRLVVPSLDREVRRELTERAEVHAVEVFARNLRNLLLQPPVVGRRVLAIDPGFRNGCKLAALDEFGGVLGTDVIYLVGQPDRRQQGCGKLVKMISGHEVSVVVIGNGSGCRESEALVVELFASELADHDVTYVVVNEAGASVYSTSPLGKEEMPDLDPTQRSAVSIGRRLLDPLSELVKINPANIGVGMYQHDVKAKHLRESLDAVVESCVNFVGVDVNTASPSLLRYVSGLNQLTAQRLYDYRRENGPFKTREALKDVPGMGEATFVQSAGFLKIAGGENPLDMTWIHPENYDIAKRIMEKLDSNVEQLVGAGKVADGGGPAAELAEKVEQVDVDPLAKELDTGVLTLHDILASLCRPGRDPREDLPQPVFRRSVMKLEDLKPGMELSGTVINVVDFGAFLDIGFSDSGLVHISRLADRYIADPHDVVSVGDLLSVWVVDVDKQRRRVSLTAIRPGTEKARQRGEPYNKQEKSTRAKRSFPGDGKPRARGRSQVPGRKSRRDGREGRQDPPKPVAPITKAMEDGTEPMRTFGDLKQFYDKSQDEGETGE